MRKIKLLIPILLMFLVISCSKDDQNAEVSSLTIKEGHLELKRLETRQLNVSIEPANASNQDIIWSSSDESVAVVNELGAVTCKYELGYTIITAKSANGIIAECRVDVVIKFP